MKYAPLWLFLSALALRLLAIHVMHFDGLYGQDGFAYFNCANSILHSLPGQVPCDGFHWPLGYPALAALFMFVVHGAPVGAQAASIITGAAIAPLAYWIVREGRLAEQAHEVSAAVAAGLIAALSGALLMSSIEVMSDAPGLFWATLSAYLLLRWERRVNEGAGQRMGGAQITWLALAAAALAIAIVTRWIYGGLVLPFGAFVVVSIYRSWATMRVAEAASPLGADHVASATDRAGLLPTLTAVAVALVPFLLILIPQLYINSHSAAPVLGHSWVVTWNPLNAVRASFDTPDGHFDYRMPPLLYSAEPLFHPAYLFPLLTPCIFFGAWYLRRSPSLILLGGWIATLYLYLIGVPYENNRFGLAYFAPVAVLAGVGVFRLPILPRRRWLLVAVSLLLAAPFTYRAAAKFESTLALQTHAIRYLQAQVPPDSTVVTFQLSISLEHYTRLRIVDLFDQSPASLRPVVCGARPVYVYVQTENLESQWIGKSPAANFHWLREAIGLQEIGAEGTWTLFRLGSCSS